MGRGAIRLLRTSTLPITRKTTTGSFNDNGEWVKGTNQTAFNIRCSIQPFRQGESKVELPIGVTAQDVRAIYTTTEMLTADEYLNQEPDETTIKNIPYECYHIEDWDNFNLQADHYKVLFVRRDKINVD